MLMTTTAMNGDDNFEEELVSYWFLTPSQSYRSYQGEFEEEGEGEGGGGEEEEGKRRRRRRKWRRKKKKTRRRSRRRRRRRSYKERKKHENADVLYYKPLSTLGHRGLCG